MNNIDIKDLITLSDDIKYVVASKIVVEEKIYLYLVGLEDNANIKFCVVDDDNHVSELDNPEQIQKLLPLFAKASEDTLKELLEENKNE